MAYPTLVNGQVTDAVSQTNVLTVGSLPANAAGNVAQASAQAFALMMENAAAHQPHGRAILDATAARCVALIAGNK